MSGRIPGQLPLVVSGGDDLTGSHHHRTHRHVTVTDGLLGLGQSPSHEGLVPHIIGRP